MSLDEEELIRTRPLLFEQRPFNRLTKRCGMLLKADLAGSPDMDTWKEEIDLDFKYFEAVITRIQLLKDTNKREIERYEKEKGEIIQTASNARDTLIALRTTLSQSHLEKGNKLHYDTIAIDILTTGGLKPRHEQYGNLERLNKEIAELEAEREDYRKVWAARRDQFGKIVASLEGMWRQIKEDKDEHDRREGMSEDEGEEGEEMEANANTPRGPPSNCIPSGSNTPFSISQSQSQSQYQSQSQNTPPKQTMESAAPSISISVSKEDKMDVELADVPTGDQGKDKEEEAHAKAEADIPEVGIEVEREGEAEGERGGEAERLDKMDES